MGDKGEKPAGSKPAKKAKAHKAFGGGGMLTQAAAMIGKTGMGANGGSIAMDGLLHATPASPAGSVASVASREAPGSARKRKRNLGDDINRRSPAFLAGQAEMSGMSLLSKAVSALEFLKKMKGQSVSIDVLQDHLLIPDDTILQSLAKSMQQNPAVTFTPPPSDGKTEPDWRLGTYAHRAKIPGVVDKLSLLEYLQKRTEMNGVAVKDIKDGWPDCDKFITELEKEKKILVIRTKKDNQARYVWMDVASLHKTVDLDVRGQWLKTPLPLIDDMPGELTKAGQKPTSHEPKIVKGSGPTKKKKTTKKAAKQTNTHLQDLLKDYSHLGKRAV